jgi:lysophospholipase L1-like esterase
MAAGILLLSGCSAAASGTGAAGQEWDRPITSGQQLYVSIGDSYAAGYQPSPSGGGATTRNGFAYQLTRRLTTAGQSVRLFNFGCSGVTSTQLMTQQGCDPGALGPGTPPYPDATQAQAATAFLRLHRDQIRLVTVVIGGNDIQACVQSPDGGLRADLPCITHALISLHANLATLLSGVRDAVGPSVPIVGLTYPDVYLGSYLSSRSGSSRQPGDPYAAHSLAGASVVLFRDQLNPALRSAYSAAGARFVDITQAADGYQPLSQTTDLAPYGTIPVAVARICALTYYCTQKDVHPTVQGHALIADQVINTVRP